MSLYKRCECGEWRCEHPWHYRFRVNGKPYRATTQTALKRQAADIEARERSRILEGRHGIRRQPDILFRDFAAHYLDASKADKTISSDRRDREIVVVLNRFFGSVLLHEITALRIEQYQKGAPRRTLARPRAEECGQAGEAGHRQPRAGHA